MRRAPCTTPSLEPILDALEAYYGPQLPHAPTDPYQFLVWWHCGYPPSEARCQQGWQTLRHELGVEPQVLRAARPARLARALSAGGLIPQLRAERVRAVATRVLEDFAGDLAAGLARLPPAQAHAALRKFPGIGPPGADRMLLFAGLAPLAAVPSSCPYVLPRIVSGRVPPGYRASYAQAQRAIEAAVPAASALRQRAYLLLLRHGRELCRRTHPQCALCPLVRRCRFNQAGERRKTAPRSRR
ncbi:MAG TPA: hypothetical protein VET66_01755 [Steroidobacteraceae bacterium]|nr:hypothetical protein [Steroidobacteraceae bacterium]